MSTTNRFCPHRRAMLGLALCGALGLTAFASPAPEKPLRVVTTIPDLADIAREIGGDRVQVKSLSKGTENLHAVRVRPSMLVSLNKADLFFEMGLSLESAWLPDLLLAARNDEIMPGKPGFVNCSSGWTPIQVPASLSRQGGDLHPQGNPHFNLDPRSGRHIAQRVYEGLVFADPAGEKTYEQRLKNYLERLEKAEARWKVIGAALKGEKFVVYHVEFNYLAELYGMEIAASLEPKPGIPPVPGDVARVVRVIKEQEVRVIATASWSNNRLVSDVARRTGAKVIEIPNQVGGAPWASSWIAFQDGLHRRLAEAFGVDWKKLTGGDEP